MAADIKAVKYQLQMTQQTIKNFKDEVVGDSPVYNNVDNHLRQLEKSIKRASKALRSLEDINVTTLPPLDDLIETVISAISAIKQKKPVENTGSLAAALAALNLFQASLNEIKSEGPSEEKKWKVEKTDTDMFAGG